MTTSAGRPPWRALATVGALALGLLTAGTTGTQSGWTDAALTGTASARSGSLAFGHAYQSTTCTLGARTAATTSCTGSIAPTVGATVSGTSATDTITNNGTTTTARVLADVLAPSCAPVSHANRATAANPLLPRHGTTFHTSGGPMDGAGYVTLDGAGTGGYATSVVAATQPGGSLVSVGRVSGVGIWFKAAPGTIGPLFSFSESPSNGAGRRDRALYLDAAGRLNLAWNESASGNLQSTSSYADNAWHFAYVTFGGITLAVSLIPQVTLWVDGAQRDVTPLLSLTSMSSYPGYWHLGWAPTSVTGLGTAYLGASLSNFVVINSGTIPSGATSGGIGVPATQVSFNAATAASTQHWLLNDTGATTFGGTLPATMTEPCGKVTLDWGFTNPVATAATAQTLAAFADNLWRTVTAPAPGTSQTSTVTVKRGAGYSTDLSGLHLYAPLSYRVQTSPAGGPWSQTFTWAGPEAAFIA